MANHHINDFSWLELDRTSSCIMEPAALHAAFHKYRTTPVVLGPITVTTVTYLWMVGAVKLGFMVLNTIFVGWELYGHYYGMNEESESGFHLFEFVVPLILWSEALVVWFSVLRVIADVIIIYFMGSGGYIQIQILADNVNIAAGFSLLPFLIVPSKLSYWWGNRQRIWQEYVKEPPLLFGRSLWTDPSLSFVGEYLEGRHLPWCIWYPGLLACFFTIQVLVPVALLVFPLLSIPAFLVKMDSLPRLRHAWAK